MNTPACVARPRQPTWHHAAERLAPVSRRHVVVEGATVEYLCWGEPGSRPMLLLHGGGANADWWHAVAILLATDFYVVAPSYSGCGNSEWRDAYSADLFAAEAVACARDAGMLGPAAQPIGVAHSFGGEVAVRLASPPAAILSQLIFVDTLLGLFASSESYAGALSRREQRFYASRSETIAKFTTVPRDAFGDPYIRYSVARRSVRRHSGSPGAWRWTWSADPNALNKTTYQDASARLRDVPCPVDFLLGELSSVGNPQLWEHQQALAGPDATFSTIPGAGHHVPLDQPQALAQAIRLLVAKRSG